MTPILTQPPSGGCVLKHRGIVSANRQNTQPPSGGCVLKHLQRKGLFDKIIQPPSGGCVLKLLVSSMTMPTLPSRLRAAVC